MQPEKWWTRPQRSCAARDKDDGEEPGEVVGAGETPSSTMLGVVDIHRKEECPKVGSEVPKEHPVLQKKIVPKVIATDHDLRPIKIILLLINALVPQQ